MDKESTIFFILIAAILLSALFAVFASADRRINGDCSEMKNLPITELPVRCIEELEAR